MDDRRRRIAVLGISIGVVLGVFLLYRQLSNVPDIEIETGQRIDFGRASEDVGRVGDVGISEIQGVTFKTYNEDKTVSREFTFERLLHKEGDEWEIEKPVMILYRQGLRCEIRAERGVVQVEDQGGGPVTKDATLSGNVVIHVVPEAGSGFSEGYAYLDNILFMSENSLFSTASPIRYVSQGLQLSGRGLEFVYNPNTAMLEYLRIAELEKLWVERLVKADDDKGKTTTAVTNEQDGADDEEQGGYRCVLRKRVRVETASEVLLADELCIENLLMTAGAQNQESAKEQGQTTEQEENAAEDSAVQEVVVTCDGGVVLEPMTGSSSADRYRLKEVRGTVDEQMLVEAVAGRETGLLGRRLIYDATNGDSRSDGFVRLRIKGDEQDDGATDIRISADEGAQFRQSQGTAVFWGDCVCEVLGPQEKGYPYKLSTPRLEIVMNEDDSQLPALTALGASELEFWTGEDTERQKVQVWSKQRARYLPEQDQIVFLGDCRCKLPVQGGGFYELLTPELAVGLPGERDGEPAVSSRGQTAVRFEFYGEDGKVERGQITSVQGAEYDPALRELVFEGNCRFAMGDEREDKYSLAAPQVTLEMGEKSDDQGQVGSVRRVVAKGPVEMGGFYVDQAGQQWPVTVRGRQEARYVPELEQVRVLGNCACEMVRVEDGIERHEMLRAQELLVNLDSEGGGRIEHVSATGDTVRLSSVTEKGGENIGGMELKCRRFDYDTGLEMFVAKGPAAQIRIDNSKAAGVAEDKKFGFSRRCFALIEDFDEFSYFRSSQRIVAESVRDKVRFAYVPVDNDGYGEAVRATAGHLEIELAADEQGDTEPVRMTATNGVTYEEGDMHFAGSRMVYDSAQERILVTGDWNEPCWYNGSAVEAIRYDLRSGKFKFKMTGPGLFSR